MNVCIITCYNQPDYIRARTLRSAAAAVDGVQVIEVKNSHKGILRYIEVLARVIYVRIRLRPDVYLLTFRGYEMLLPVRLTTIGKPLIYDEFIHPVEWAAYEHKKVSPDGFIVKLFTIFYRTLLRSVQLVITDTESHADLSAQLTGINRDKLVSLPVGTDELVFSPENKTSRRKKKELTVFYYGNMLPLHGLPVVIDTAQKMQDRSIRFVLVGGNEGTERMVAEAIKHGARIEYKKWVDFEELPHLMQAADVCLAGPFGGTYQAQYVITGKAYQYLAMGRPTIVGENKESHAFSHKENALIVQQSDATSLSRTLEWAIDHPDELKKIGSSGRVLYENHFSHRVLTDQISSILGRVSLAAPAKSDQ